MSTAIHIIQHIFHSKIFGSVYSIIITVNKWKKRSRIAFPQLSVQLNSYYTDL